MPVIVERQQDRFADDKNAALGHIGRSIQNFRRSYDIAWANGRRTGKQAGRPCLWTPVWFRNNNWPAPLRKAKKPVCHLADCSFFQGILSEQVMTSALNAQTMLVAGRITRDEALKSLKSTVRRTETSQTAPAEKDFYQLPDRNRFCSVNCLLQRDRSLNHS